MPVEENQRRGDTVASASKPLGSLVQINSIAIDISCTMREIEEPPVHEHFSIRGFVAGIRRKDWKTCLPFDSNDDDVLVENLPPLPIPKSRWWRCSDCVPDIADERIMLEAMPIAIKNYAGTSSYPVVDGEQDGLLMRNIQRTGDEHESRDSRYKEECGPSNKMINSSKQSYDGNKATTSSRDKTDPQDNEGGNTDGHIAEDALDLVLANEVDNVSSGSDGPFNVLVHRRKRKLRSLADIMYEERNSTGEHSRMKSGSSSETQVKSTEVEADLDPQPRFDVSADVGRSTKSPQKKKRNGLEEDRGASEITSPANTAKRPKATILDSEKTCRQIEHSDSKSEGNASARLDVRFNAKTLQIKPKKNKALDINKKTRQTDTDNRTMLTRDLPKINSSVHSANLHKNTVASETDLGTVGGFLPTIEGEKESCLLSFPPEKQMDRISYLAKVKRPVVEVDNSPLMTPTKSILNDHGIQREVALELSLTSCVGTERNTNSQISFRQQPSSIPDLNESFNEKATIQEKQLLTVSEKRMTPHRTLEMLGSCSKETAREGKRKLGVPEAQGVQNINSTIETGGVSDDIPMEIVELLAKNQQERALGNSRQQILREEVHSSSIRGSPAVYLDGCPSTFNFPPRTSVSFTSNDMGLSHGILNFPQTKNCRLDTGNLDNGQFRLFSSFPSHQHRKTPYPALNSVVSGPRPSEGSDLLWPPRSKNIPFHPSVAPNCSITPNTLGMQPFPDHCYKGKPINNFKGKGKIVCDTSSMKEGRMSSNHKSLDAYANDTIPAMQLLSLMDRRIISGSFKMGKNSFLDKPFSPCSHHPQINGSENQSSPFPNASTFSQSSHTKNFPAFLNGVCFPGESLKKTYLRGQIPRDQGPSKASIHFPGTSKSAIQPLNEDLHLGNCVLNRNPADFTIPDANNEYTISAKDLKPRKRNALKERRHLTNMEGPKRQRARKDPGKDLARK